MKANLTSLFMLGLLIPLLSPNAYAQNEVRAQFGKRGDQGEVRVHSRMRMPVSSMVGEYTILRSTNMTVWEPVAGPFRGGVGISDEVLRQAVPLAGDRAFYRVSAEVKLVEEGDLGSSIYGYGTEFSQRLQQIGQIPLEQFAERYPPPDYLQQITFDPTAAEFWTDFSAAGLAPNADELTMFQTNAFVVSQRLGSYSFANAFYKVFTADLPVYLSCDAVLHAWHRSYVNMLEELEESYISPRLILVFNGMGSQVSSLSAAAAGTPLADGVRDADYFIAVARSLVTGINNYGSLGQNAKISDTLTDIANLQPAVDIQLFGTTRQVDFTQFQVRGHYETSTRLAKYFRAMMWCGMIDFRFTGRNDDNSLRELSGAVAMHLLLKNSGQFNNWKQMDDVIQMFVGAPDALNVAQLSDVLTSAGVNSPANLPNVAALEVLRSNIMSGTVGVQNIQGGYFWSPLSTNHIKLPRSFAFMPTRFTMDGWSLSQCVFDRIFWVDEGVPIGQTDWRYSYFGKIMRRVPSALDVAFSVFGNNAVTPMVVQRIADPEGHPWRDGRPYQHNLAAVRDVLDAQDVSGWTNNIYQYWLACLRELSSPTTDPEYPDVMRTREWAMKTLNTQLASWTELKHDTVLYAKQPYTGNVLCSYPKGFIEPRVAFWERMRQMALRSRALLATLPQTGQFVFEPNTPFGEPITSSISSIYAARLSYLDNFASRMQTLKDISVKELARQPLSIEEAYFIESLIENPAGYGGALTYSGWYPGLFYANVRAKSSGMLSVSDLWDPMVTDVHTNPRDDIVGDPGCILHQAVGDVGLLTIAVNWGLGDACAYAGPVLSHYEFETPPTTRKTDSQWKAEIKAGTLPPQPEWTRGYLVPGNISYYPFIY